MTGRSDDAREAMDDRVEAAVKAEQVRWQERLEFLQREYGVDGGGCDSGDPLDFTEDEVRQALASARAAGAAEAFEKARAAMAERAAEWARDSYVASNAYAQAFNIAEAAIRALAKEERK